MGRSLGRFGVYHSALADVMPRMRSTFVIGLPSIPSHYPALRILFKSGQIPWFGGPKNLTPMPLVAVWWSVRAGFTMIVGTVKYCEYCIGMSAHFCHLLSIWLSLRPLLFWLLLVWKWAHSPPYPIGLSHIASHTFTYNDIRNHTHVIACLFGRSWFNLAMVNHVLPDLGHRLAINIHQRMAIGCFRN